MFRREWVWNESKQEYDNLGDLKRDPETGLFPEPSPFPEQLKGKAHWDPYVALYITNLAQIDHKTGKVTTNLFADAAPDAITPPEYTPGEKDPFDIAHEKFQELRTKYMSRSESEHKWAEDVIQLEGLTPEWFGIKTSDLTMLLDKLERGADSEYTMMLIKMLTNVGIEKFHVSYGTHEDEKIWRDKFNKLTSEASERVKSGNIKELGYLALPLIYDELKNGKGDELLPQLSDVANGQKGLVKAETAKWDKAKWIKWFEDNKADMDSLRYVLTNPIKMPWLDKVKT